MGYTHECVPGHQKLHPLNRGIRSLLALLFQAGASVALTVTTAHAIGKIALVTAKVYDSSTLAPLNDATIIVATPAISTTGVTCISGKLRDGITPGTSGECTLSVTAETTVSLEATKTTYQLKTVIINVPDGSSLPVDFLLNGSTLPSLRIGASYYSNLAAAYAAATTGCKVQLTARTFAGPFVFNRGIVVTLESGYDATYSATRSGYSELTGSVTISGGQVTMDRVVVK